MSDVAKRVKEIIAEQLGVDEAQVVSEASFMDDLGADSLDTVELVMALEEEFDLEIPSMRMLRRSRASRMPLSTSPSTPNLW